MRSLAPPPNRQSFKLVSLFLPTPSHGTSNEAGAPDPLTLGTGMAADLAEASGAGTGVVLATG